MRINVYKLNYKIQGLTVEKLHSPRPGREGTSPARPGPNHNHTSPSRSLVRGPPRAGSLRRQPGWRQLPVPPGGHSPCRPFNGRSRRQHPNARADPRADTTATRRARESPPSTEPRPPRSSPAHHSRLHPGAACAIQAPPAPALPRQPPPPPWHNGQRGLPPASACVTRPPRDSADVTAAPAARPPRGRRATLLAGAVALRRAGGDTGLRSAAPCREGRLAAPALSSAGGRCLARSRAAAAALSQREPPGRARGAITGRQREGSSGRAVSFGALKRHLRFGEQALSPGVALSSPAGHWGAEIHHFVGATAAFPTFPVSFFGLCCSGSNHVHQREMEPYKQRIHKTEKWL